MRLEQLEVTNWCRHRHRQIDLQPGLTAIVGSNGAGKSNLVGALRYALTGINPNVGKAEQNISQQAGPAEKSFVRLQFSHAGIAATVTRYLRPAKPTATLELTGQPTIQGAEAVTAKICEILGLSTDVINEIVVVAQSDIFGFLDKTPAARDQVFQRLFRTEQARSVYDALGVQLKTIQIPSLAVSLEQLTSEVAAAEQSLQGCQQRLTPLPSHAEAQQQRDANVAVQQAYTQRQLMEQQAGTWASQLAELAGKYTSAGDADTVATHQHVTLDAAVSQMLPAVEAAKSKLAVLGEQQRQAAYLRQMTDRLTALRSSLSLLDSRPPVPPVTVPRAELVEEQADAVQQLSYWQRLLDTFKNGVAECPLCHTPVTTLLSQIELAKQQVPRLQEVRDQAAAAITSLDAFQRVQQQYTAEYAQATQGCRDCEAAIAATPAAGETIDEAAMRQVLQQYADALAVAGQAAAAARTAASVLVQIRAQRNQLTEVLERQQNVLAGMASYTTEQVTQAAANVTAWEQCMSQRREAEQQLAVAQEQLADRQRQWQLVTKQVSEIAKLREWQTLLTATQAVVHASALPRFVAQRNLERLQGALNDYLTYFETDYRVSAQQGLSFEARFADGRVQPAERLSGGQQVVLALAFRLALNLLTAEQIGVLVLDEPTAYLDEHHIRGFEPVLSRLRDLSASRGLQCLMVTHERSLAPLFDDVVRLD